VAFGEEPKNRASVAGRWWEVKYTVVSWRVFTGLSQAVLQWCAMMLVVVCGIVLAAGASTRMGRPKAALPLTDRADTFVRRLSGTCLQAGLPDVVVVSGAHDSAVRAALAPPDRRVTVIEHAGWAEGQLSSLVAGLQVATRVHPDLVEAAVVMLVDTPLVSPATVRAVVSAWRATRAPIVRPARGGEHGHPVLFDRAVFAALAAADVGVGAKAVVRAREREILNLSIDDEGAFLDVDTDVEYDALLQRMSRR
jgi:molybdenum cofactor cytidylyltransferase